MTSACNICMHAGGASKAFRQHSPLKLKCLKQVVRCTAHGCSAERLHAVDVRNVLAVEGSTSTYFKIPTSFAISHTIVFNSF